jgi:DNA primase
MHAWCHVSPHEPCRICAKPDWCAVSADGAWAPCRRLDTGAGIHKVDKTGADYWLYRLDSPTPSRQPIIEQPSQPCRSRVERADPATLDRVYRALLAALPLSSTHRQAQRQRGLPDVAIVRCGYRTLPRDGRAALARRLVDRYGPDTCARVPGLWVDTQGTQRWWTLAGAPGLLIPVRNIDNRIVALKVRADSAGEGPKYTYLSSRRHDGLGPGAPVHVPLHAFSLEAPVRLTEGELKADVATALSEVLTIAVPGVTLWRQALPILAALQPVQVLLAFDSDWRQNPYVARALAQATQALVEAGLTVVVETWDASQGKGIDDVLRTGYTPTRQSAVPWLHRARTLPEKSGGRPSHIVVEVR